MANMKMRLQRTVLNWCMIVVAVSPASSLAKDPESFPSTLPVSNDIAHVNQPIRRLAPLSKAPLSEIEHSRPAKVSGAPSLDTATEDYHGRIIRIRTGIGVRDFAEDWFKNGTNTKVGDLVEFNNSYFNSVSKTYSEVSPVAPRTKYEVVEISVAGVGKNRLISLGVGSGRVYNLGEDWFINGNKIKPGDLVTPTSEYFREAKHNPVEGRPTLNPEKKYKVIEVIGTDEHTSTGAR